MVNGKLSGLPKENRKLNLISALSRGRGGIDWQFNHKPCPHAAGGIFNPNAAVVRFDDSVRNGQPHATAGHPPVGNIAVAQGAKELFKDAIANLRANARAAIFDADRNNLIVFLVSPNGNWRLGW